MDTQFWGPSGWQLFHLITFEKGMLSHKKQLFGLMKDILPCKYCRESASEFMKEIPLDNNLAFWLYKFHDRVNLKLEKQHAEDPKVHKPVPSPPFEEVVSQYKALLKSDPKKIPGRDFLYSIAYNYDPQYHDVHSKFWDALQKVFPYYKFRKHVVKPRFDHYLEDVHSMMVKMGDPASLKSVQQQLAYFKSGCKTKTYKGKTCRKTGGGYTKKRDRRRTFRITHGRLIGSSS
jgi:hypothetical protein